MSRNLFAFWLCLACFFGLVMTAADAFAQTESVATQLSIDSVKDDPLSGNTEFSGLVKNFDCTMYGCSIRFYTQSNGIWTSQSSLDYSEPVLKSDGSWKVVIKTQSYSRVIALLVNDQYFRSEMSTAHPSLYGWSYAWDEYPKETPEERAKYYLGDLTKPPTISFDEMEVSNFYVSGVANNIDLKTTRVAIYALTDHWYVQPDIYANATQIRPDGKWKNYSNSWKRIVALLVDNTFSIEKELFLHPSLSSGVLTWAEFPRIRTDLPIKFADYNWGVKISDYAFDPGPNYFSGSEENVFVDNEGMHLKIVEKDGKWTCPEIYLSKSLGYGIYTFQTRSDLSTIDPQSTFSMFLYEDLGKEMDIEFSEPLAGNDKAQYVVQPWLVDGNIIRFDLPQAAPTSHRIEWREDKIVYTSWKGLSSNPVSGREIFSWTYTNKDFIPKPGGERLHFNLWLYDGKAPQNGIGGEVVVTSFFYSLEMGPTGVEEIASAPRQFLLGQNYPNPFNPSTTISYQLQSSSQVDIEILNVVGQRVATFNQGRQAAGRHEFIFDGSKLTSGVYFYALRVNGNPISTKRMVLMK